ncbi:MAG TPA: hypothetical protein VGE26_01190 [Sphingobacteriaceae bacterium]
MKKAAYICAVAGIAILSCQKDPALNISDETRLGVTDPPDTVVAANFVAGVNNEYFPLTPGKRYRYRKTTVNGTDTIRQDLTVEVRYETKVIEGITCMVVREVLMQDTATLEETFAWYAQDLSGTVWKFGEDKKTFAGGIVNTEGSWMAGIDSARAGIKMHGNPGAHIGVLYYQEYAIGVAEDQGLIHDTTRTATVPYGTFMNCVRIHDSTALDSASTRHKWYASGVGYVFGSSYGDVERTELVAVEDFLPTAAPPTGSIRNENSVFRPSPRAVSPAGKADVKRKRIINSELESS